MPKTSARGRIAVALAVGGCLTGGLAAVGHAAPNPEAPELWEDLAPLTQARQEAAYVQVGGKFYLGAGETGHQDDKKQQLDSQHVYDPQTNSWSETAPMPHAVDHVQSVAIGDRIYYIGGLEGFPGPHVNHVQIYDISEDRWIEGAPMPKDRARGAGGVVAHEGKVYYVGGLRDDAPDVPYDWDAPNTAVSGEKAVDWMDVYDPETDSWEAVDYKGTFTARDHFQAVVHSGKLWAIAGRDLDISKATNANEAYDFATNTWKRYAPMNLGLRGGFAAAAHGEDIVMFGGEGQNAENAAAGKEHTTFWTVNAYNVRTGTWRRISDASLRKPAKDLRQPSYYGDPDYAKYTLYETAGRHGIQGATCNGGIYIAGGGEIGGREPVFFNQALFLDETRTPCTEETADVPAATFVANPAGGKLIEPEPPVTTDPGTGTPGTGTPGTGTPGTGTPGTGTPGTGTPGTGTTTTPATTVKPAPAPATATAPKPAPAPAPAPKPTTTPAPPPAPSVQAADVLAPQLRGVRLADASVARGTRITLKLRASEAVTLRAVVHKRGRSGRYTATARGVTRRTAAGRLTLQVPTRGLAAGRYRLVVTATDAAGNRSAASRVGFALTR